MQFRIQFTHVNPRKVREGPTAMGEFLSRLIQEVDPQGLGHSGTPINRCTAAQADDNPVHTAGNGILNQFAGPVSRGQQRVTSLRIDELKPACGGHLNHRRVAGTKQAIACRDDPVKGIMDRYLNQLSPGRIN